MLNTDVLVREQGDVLTGGDGATVKMQTLIIIDKVGSEAGGGLVNGGG